MLMNENKERIKRIKRVELSAYCRHASVIMNETITPAMRKYLSEADPHKNVAIDANIEETYLF